MDNDDYTLSINGDDLILITGKVKYICKSCIDHTGSASEPNLRSKKTRRLLYAIKQKANMTISFEIIDDDVIELHVSHPLYDDDIYQMCVYPNKHNKNNKHDKHDDTIKYDNIRGEKDQLSYVYILELEQEKYYVGKSASPLARTGEHLATTLYDDKMFGGSGWTRMYLPIRIIEIIKSYDEFDEDIYTLKYMQKYGIDNVRGGSFCELNLPRENVVTLEKMLAGAGDKCYYCGMVGHFVNSCPQKNMRRITQKHKKVNISAKNQPKSKILKYFSATKLLDNSDLDNSRMDTNTNISHKEPKATIMRKNTVTQNDISGYVCRYCTKRFDNKQKKNDHENVTCKHSDKARRARLAENDVDAILAANDKYIKK